MERTDKATITRETETASEENNEKLTGKYQ
jgi:hypothetical protein